MSEQATAGVDVGVYRALFRCARPYSFGDVLEAGNVLLREIERLRISVDAERQRTDVEMALANRQASAVLTYGRHFESCTGELGADDCCECGWSDTEIEAKRVDDRELPTDAERDLCIAQSQEQRIESLQRKLEQAGEIALHAPHDSSCAKLALAKYSCSCFKGELLAAIANEEPRT